MRTFRIVAFITTILGLVNSIYLAIIKFSNNPQLCIQGVGDCWSVNTSKYSELLGIPVAVFGFLALLTYLLMLLGESKYPQRKTTFVYAEFALTFLCLIFSIYLTYVEFFVIDAVCPFCVLSAIFVIILFIRSVWMLAHQK